MVKRVVTEAVGKTVIRLKPPHARRLDSVIEAEQRAKAERPLRGYLTTAPVEEEEAIAVERDLVFN